MQAIQPAKGENMKTHRLFYLIVAVALLVVVGLTIREAAATTIIITQADATGQSSVAYASLPSSYSIRSEYVEALGIWVIYTEDGPTGVDGGLIQLMSDYRTCSR
jgi:hypothetical protein